MLSLLDEFTSQAAIAKVAGVDAPTVWKWFELGRMSRRGAIAMAEATGREKEEFRPDLMAKDWEMKISGRVPSQAAANDTADARLLVQLAEKYGSVRELCDLVSITVSDYHTWKSRGRIPAIKLPTLMAAR